MKDDGPPGWFVVFIVATLLFVDCSNSSYVKDLQKRVGHLERVVTELEAR